MFTSVPNTLLTALLFSAALIAVPIHAAQPPAPSADLQSNQPNPDLAFVWGSETVWPSDPSIWPGAVFLTGNQAQPLAIARNNQIPGAIARYGKGRVAVFAHTGFVDPGGLLWKKSAPLAVQLTNWLANRTDIVPGGEKNRKIKILACQTHNNLPLVEQVVEQEGIEIKTVRNWSDINWDKPDFDVLVCYTWNVPEELFGNILDFVRNGGALWTGVTPWVKNSPRFKSEFPSNRLVRPFGLVFTTNGCETTVPEGFARIERPNENLNLEFAIERIRSAQDQKSIEPQVWQTLSEGLIWTDDLYLETVLPQVVQAAQNLTISEAKPLKTNDKPLEKLIASWQNLQAKERFLVTGDAPLPLKNHSSHAFPGPVDDSAERVSRSVEINCAVPDWSSTGLYAPAGETVTVRVPKAIVDNGKFAIRVGCHRDTLWHLDEWKRYPEISFETAIRSPEIRVNSAFGGLIYIVVPQNAKELAKQSVDIEGAVDAPLFVLDKTTPEEWSRMKLSDAPWGELASSKFIISIPKEVYQTVTDPDKVMRYWDRVLDTDAEFAGRPKERMRPERMVCDVQISAGYMHSGYPVMTWMDVRHRFVSCKGDWGFYHELGHNHQSRDWTFAGSGEVTVNWFTMYCFEQIDGIPQDGPQGRMSPPEMLRLKKRHEANGATWESWKADPFIGLAMFVELKQKYGWDAFKKLIADYNDDSPENRPKNDDQIRDQMLVRLSRITGDDLGPFFKKWGVPVSDDALSQAAQAADDSK